MIALVNGPSSGIGAAGVYLYTHAQYPDYHKATMENAVNPIWAALFTADQYFSLKKSAVIGLRSGRYWENWR